MFSSRTPEKKMKAEKLRKEKEEAEQKAKQEAIFFLSFS